MYDSAMVGNFEDIIGEKIVETLSSNGVASKNKTIHTPPLFPSDQPEEFIYGY